MGSNYKLIFDLEVDPRYSDVGYVTLVEALELSVANLLLLVDQMGEWRRAQVIILLLVGIFVGIYPKEFSIWSVLFHTRNGSDGLGAIASNHNRIESISESLVCLELERLCLLHNRSKLLMSLVEFVFGGSQVIRLIIDLIIMNQDFVMWDG